MSSPKLTNSPAQKAGLSIRNPSSKAYIWLATALLAAFLTAAVSCGGDDAKPSSDPVSVARIRSGEKINGECSFADDLSKYPVTYSNASEDCWQAVSIGPLSLDELEQMKQDEPLFWGKSSPYRQVLVGEWIDGECKFDHPAVQAVLEFSETVSTDWTACQRLVNMGPATEKQIEELQSHGATESESAVPDPSKAVPGQ